MAGWVVPAKPPWPTPAVLASQSKQALQDRRPGAWEYDKCVLPAVGSHPARRTRTARDMAVYPGADDPAAIERAAGRDPRRARSQVRPRLIGERATDQHRLHHRELTRRRSGAAGRRHAPVSPLPLVLFSPGSGCGQLLRGEGLAVEGGAGAFLTSGGCGHGCRAGLARRPGPTPCASLVLCLRRPPREVRRQGPRQVRALEQQARPLPPSVRARRIGAVSYIANSLGACASVPGASAVVSLVVTPGTGGSPWTRTLISRWRAWTLVAAIGEWLESAGRS